MRISHFIRLRLVNASCFPFLAFDHARLRSIVTGFLDVATMSHLTFVKLL